MLKTVINCHMRNRGLQKQTEKVPCTGLLNYLHTFVLLIFSRFLILFIYIINIGHWQVLFITQEQLGKSQSATSTFKHCSCTCFRKMFFQNIFWLPAQIMILQRVGVGALIVELQRKKSSDLLGHSAVKVFTKF